MTADVISMLDARARRGARTEVSARPRGGGLSSFYFDLGDPFTYLTAERVHRGLPTADWVPASAEAFSRLGDWADAAHEQRAGDRARALNMPLSWPEATGSRAVAANRAASYASERGRGAAFALAASRLAFCGGFDLGDPEVLAEAAAAAGIALEGCMRAAGDAARDRSIEAAGRRLLAAGAQTLPVLCVGPRVFSGEQRLAAALACARGQLSAAGA